MHTPYGAEGFTGTALPMPAPIPSVVNVPGRSLPNGSAIAAARRWLDGSPTRKRASTDARAIPPTSSAVGFLEIYL